MNHAAESVLPFLFIIALSLGLPAAIVVGLFATGALFDALEHPGDLRGRVEGIFRQPLKAAKMAGKNHYYRPYWKQS